MESEYTKIGKELHHLMYTENDVYKGLVSTQRVVKTKQAFIDLFHSMTSKQMQVLLTIANYKIAKRIRKKHYQLISEIVNMIKENCLHVIDPVSIIVDYLSDW